MDIRFGTFKCCLCRVGLLKIVSSELVKYNLDLVAVQKSDGLWVVIIQWMIIQFSMEMEMLIIT
jgi:hypothetical protein